MTIWKSLISLSLLVCLASAQAVPRYRITDLGVPPGYQASYATCLNDRGQVAGNLRTQRRTGTGQEGTAAFLWKHGQLYLLPSLPSPYSSTHEVYDAVASGINNRGQVVGTVSYFFDGAWMGTDLQAVLWERGRIYKIPRLAWPGGARPGRTMNQNTAMAINDAGQVAGTADDDFVSGEGMPHLYLYVKGRSMDLGPGCAMGLNRQGQVSGYVLMDAQSHPSSEGIVNLGSTPPITQVQAILCRTAGPRLTLGQGYAVNLDSRGNVIGVNEAVVDMGEPPLLRTRTTDALAAGMVTYRKMFAHNHKITNIIGPRKTNAASTAQVLLWRTGDGHSRAVALPIRWLPQAINARGQIVGSRSLWQHGQAYDLNHLIGQWLGWNVVMATAINNSGQIAGWGYRRGKPRAFLMTPQR